MKSARVVLLGLAVAGAACDVSGGDEGAPGGALARQDASAGDGLPFGGGEAGGVDGGGPDGDAGDAERGGAPSDAAGVDDQPVVDAADAVSEVDLLARIDADADPPLDSRTEVLLEAEVELDAATSFHLESALGPGEALFLEARGEPDGLYGFVSISGPDGQVVGEPAGGEVSRLSASPETATALIPNSDSVVGVATFAAGEWGITVRALGGRAGLVQLRVLRVRRPGRSLRVVVGLPPQAEFLVAAEALETFREALADRIAERLGLEAEVALLDLNVGAPSILEVEAARGDLSHFGDLARAFPADAPSGLRLVLLDQILDGENRLGGLCGGLPVPSTAGSSAADVVAVRARLLPDFPEAVADAACHEIGHALGLWHTTEGDGSRADPVGDTPVCPVSCDADGDGLLLARECGAHGEGAAPCAGAADNFMFWTLGGEPASTVGQRRVVARHPVLGD